MNLDNLKHTYLTGKAFGAIQEKDLFGKDLKVEGDDGNIYALLHELQGNVVLLNFCPGKANNQRRNRTYLVFAYDEYGLVVLLKLYDQLAKFCNSVGLKVEMSLANCYSQSGSVVRTQIAKFMIRAVVGEYTHEVRERAHDAVIVSVNRLAEMRRQGSLYD